MRSLVVVALGGNAMTAPDGTARPEDQQRAVGVAAAAIADLLTGPDPVDVVITHGNGPQVGNLLVKNELAAHVVPPVPLDWCSAQTQATIGTLLMDALDRELAERGDPRRTATLVTRTLVSPDDPHLRSPSKPIGRWLSAEEARPMIEHGETWRDLGERGWRRVVASPEPLEILDAPPVGTLVDAGYVVVAAGGGGIPTVRDPDGTLRGVEAVIDKDLGAALLAQTLDADALVIATDVPHVVLGYGTDAARPLERVTLSEMESHAAAGEFAEGSMGPKVEAVCRFVRQRGRPATITDLEHIRDAASGSGGTTVVPG